jgi:hypothetical protein
MEETLEGILEIEAAALKKVSSSTPRLHATHLSVSEEFVAFIKPKLRGRKCTEDMNKEGKVLGWTIWETL